MNSSPLLIHDVRVAPIIRQFETLKEQKVIILAQIF